MDRSSSHMRQRMCQGGSWNLPRGKLSVTPYDRPARPEACRVSARRRSLPTLVQLHDPHERLMRSRTHVEEVNAGRAGQASIAPSIPS